jgi:hypothetical protein
MPLPSRAGASVTQFQYEKLKMWAAGDFIEGQPIESYGTFNATGVNARNVPLVEQHAALDRSALESGSAHALNPGESRCITSIFDVLQNKYCLHRVFQTSAFFVKDVLNRCAWFCPVSGGFIETNLV